MSRSGSPIYEDEIQRIWAEQDFNSSELKTVNGKKIEVFFTRLVESRPGSRLRGCEALDW